MSIQRNKSFVKLTADQSNLLSHIDGNLKQLREKNLKNLDKLNEKELREVTVSSYISSYMKSGEETSI